MDHRNRTRVALLSMLMGTLAACGGGGSSDGGAGAASPDPAPAPSPGPSPAAATVRVTATSLLAGGRVGCFFTKVGTRAFLISEFTPGPCANDVSPKTFSATVPAGQTLTIVAAEDAVDFQTINGVGDAKLHPAPGLESVQFVSWSSPCATRERGVCVVQPSGDVAISVVYKPLTPIAFGEVGEEPWQATIDAPARVFPGSNGARQSLTDTAQRVPGDLTAYCRPGAPGSTPVQRICAAAFMPDSGTLTLSTLPLDPPVGTQTTPFAFVGFGGGCGGASGSSCTLTAGTGDLQVAWFKWQYYLCGAPNFIDATWGSSQYLFNPPNPACPILVTPT